jgi:hypothetical protein
MNLSSILGNEAHFSLNHRLQADAGPLQTSINTIQRNGGPIDLDVTKFWDFLGGLKRSWLQAIQSPPSRGEYVELYLHFLIRHVVIN